MKSRTVSYDRQALLLFCVVLCMILCMRAVYFLVNEHMQTMDFVTSSIFIRSKNFRGDLEINV